MSTDKDSGSRSIHIGGNVKGSTVISGDNNTAMTTFNNPAASPADTESIRLELNELRKILADLASADRKKIDNAMEEAADELEKPAPNKDEVGKALDRALEYSKKADQFNTVITKLKPHVMSISAWLGTNWPHITACLGS